MNTERQDVYTRVTAKIVAHLENGVRPWLKPWNAANTNGRITRPLRHNGVPYSGINILMLWASAIEQGFTAPMWMTFKQALELDAHAREELAAELGSAFLCADLDLTQEVREDHASYLACWLDVLKNDKRAIFSAAAHAQRAIDFLHELQRPKTDYA